MAEEDQLRQQLERLQAELQAAGRGQPSPSAADGGGKPGRKRR